MEYSLAIAALSPGTGVATEGGRAATDACVCPTADFKSRSKFAWQTSRSAPGVPKHISWTSHAALKSTTPNGTSGTSGPSSAPHPFGSGFGVPSHASLNVVGRLTDSDVGRTEKISQAGKGGKDPEPAAVRLRPHHGFARGHAQDPRKPVMDARHRLAKRATSRGEIGATPPSSGGQVLVPATSDAVQSPAHSSRCSQYDHIRSGLTLCRISSSACAVQERSSDGICKSSTNRSILPNSLPQSLLTFSLMIETISSWLMPILASLLVSAGTYGNRCRVKGQEGARDHDIGPSYPRHDPTFGREKSWNRASRKSRPHFEQVRAGQGADAFRKGPHLRKNTLLPHRGHRMSSDRPLNASTQTNAIMEPNRRTRLGNTVYAKIAKARIYNFASVLTCMINEPQNPATEIHLFVFT